MRRVAMKEWIHNRDDYAYAELKTKLSFSLDNKPVFWKRGEKIILPVEALDQLSASFGDHTFRRNINKFYNIYRPYEGQDLNNKTLLIGRAGGIGDIIYLQPVLMKLKEKYPTCKIHLTHKDRFKQLSEKWECVDKYVPYPPTFKDYVHAHYHVLLYGVVERIEEALDTNLYQLMAKFSGLGDMLLEELQPKLIPNSDIIDECKTILNDMGIDKFILSQPLSSSENRTPPFGFWKSIYEYVYKISNLPIVLIDNPLRSDYMDKFAEAAGEHVINFSRHSKNIGYSIAMSSLSELNICPNTAMIPISHGLDHKVLSIHGAFPGYIRWNGSPKHQWIDSTVGCAPCYGNSEDGCNHEPKMECFAHINVMEFLEKLRGLLDVTETD